MLKVSSASQQFIRRPAVHLCSPEGGSGQNKTSSCWDMMVDMEGGIINHLKSEEV